MITDFGAAWLIPDPASASGVSMRVIGYAPSAEAVLAVSLLPSEADVVDPPAGDWWAERVVVPSSRPQDLRAGQRDVIAMSRVDDIIAAESDDLEQAELPEPLPEHVRVERQQ